MFYPAKFEKEDNGYTVTFRDLPEAITCADSEEDAMVMAEDVLLSTVEVYFEMDKPFPAPSIHKQGETLVALPDSVYATVLLHNAMLEQGLTKAAVARLSGIRPPEIQRILNPRHTTKIDTVSHVLSAIGKPLTLTAA